MSFKNFSSSLNTPNKSSPDGSSKTAPEVDESAVKPAAAADEGAPKTKS